MTCIAWDGRTLAADKQATAGCMRQAATKIYRVDDALVALSGDSGIARAILAWYRGVRDPREYPRQVDDDGSLIVFTREGVDLYCSTGYGFPEPIENSFIAFGSGRDYAMAAMHLGSDARQAVEVACEFDAFCGMGIDVLELDE